MTSSVNPNNIDGTYPVAGQDNDSQGFRDNFTNIKNNFQFTKTELEDLQSKVVLKANLSGTSLDNNMADSLIKAAKIQDFRETVYDVGTVSGNITINHANGHYQTITPNANVTMSFSNWPAAGSAGRLKTEFVISNTSYSVTLPAISWNGNATLVGLTGNTLVFNATGNYVYEWFSRDGGTTVTAHEVTRGRKPVANTFVGINSNVTTRAIDFNIDEFVLMQANANVTVTYANVSAGKRSILTVRNVGANAIIVTMPNASNNKANANISVANSVYSTFMLNSHDTTSANVVAFIANA